MGTIPTLSECNPGFDPVEYNVIIAPETVEEKTKGGVYIPDVTKTADEAAAVRGLLVATSALSFNYDTWPDDAPKPKPGNVIIFAKYAGTLIKGDDGREYRLCKDKDICAVVR